MKTEPHLTPLLLHHFNEINFELRLRHIHTGLYFGKDELVVSRHTALMKVTDPHGLSKRDLFQFFSHDLGSNWVIREYAPWHFEIESCLRQP